jgi:hypothetical protein
MSCRFEGPLGDFSLRESERPIVFVAGATGFAPVKSMVEDAFHRGLKRPIYLYWGVRKLADLYLPDLPQRWARDHENFHFIPVLSDAGAGRQLEGRTGLVHEAILADFPDLAGKEIYACGSVKMVEAIFPSLKNQGAEEGMCFSDAFTVSARSMAFQPKGFLVAPCRWRRLFGGQRGGGRQSCPRHAMFALMLLAMLLQGWYAGRESAIDGAMVDNAMRRSASPPRRRSKPMAGNRGSTCRDGAGQGGQDRMARYGRIIGKLILLDPPCATCPKTLDAGLAQLEAGLAWWDREARREQSLSGPGLLRVRRVRCQSAAHRPVAGCRADSAPGVAQEKPGGGRTDYGAPGVTRRFMTPSCP